MDKVREDTTKRTFSTQVCRESTVCSYYSYVEEREHVVRKFATTLKNFVRTLVL